MRWLLARMLLDEASDKGSGGAPPAEPPKVEPKAPPKKKDELPPEPEKDDDEKPATSADALSAHDRRIAKLEEGGAVGLGAGAVIGIVLLAVTVGALIFLGARFLLSKLEE